MASKGNKQGGKKKKTTSKKTSVQDAAPKNTNAKKSNTTAKKKTSTKKNPASFSRNANAKSTSKKTPKKTETPEKAKNTSSFTEFETLRLHDTEKLDSKIIIRDVEREAPITAEPVIPSKPETTLKDPKPEVIAKPTHDIVIPKPTAKEVKEQEIAKAIKAAAKLPATTNESRRRRNTFGEFGWRRALLAAACAVTAVFAVVYFINTTSVDMPLKAAASQSGISAAYPSFIPRGYELSDVTSSSGRVSMHFRSSEGEYGITEEVSNWDSEALLNNYIKPTYANDYSIIREQGLTLFIGDKWEAWVNGGVLYKLTVSEGELTKKQMKSIATSF